jgi:opacity protein-like surface antigen
MKKLVLTAAAAAALAASAMTFASGTPMVQNVMNPWYVGVGINTGANYTNSLKDANITSTAIPRASDQVKINNKSIGGNIFVGYRMSRIFGAELGFSGLGTTKYKATIDTTSTTTVTNASVKPKLSNQWNLYFVGQAFMPISQMFQPYVFAGVGYMNAKFSVPAVTINSVNYTAASQNNGTFGLVYGAGLAFNFNQFGVRVSYTRQDASNHASLNPSRPGNGNLVVTAPSFQDYISLDVLYRFGM